VIPILAPKLQHATINLPTNTSQKTQHTKSNIETPDFAYYLTKPAITFEAHVTGGGVSPYTYEWFVKKEGTAKWLLWVQTV
jgi:hypothetical protein